MQYRFTQMAANVMHYSKEVAAELNHSYIGTEHILIGLLREKEGLACQVLEDHDVTEEKVLHMVSQLIQGSQTMVAEPEEYTPRSRRILEIANREAMRFRASAIGTEHLLIAILRETDCVAAQLLYSLGRHRRFIRILYLVSVWMPGQRRQICRRPRASREERMNL